MRLKASLQHAAQPDGMAPAVHSAHAVAAKAEPCSLLQPDSDPFSSQGLCMVPPLS